MADAQSDPPDLKHLAPRWFHAYIDELRDWLRTHRPVQGKNTTLSDAPGGGKAINVELPSSLLKRTPWRVYAQTEMSGGSVSKLSLKVEVESHLLKSHKLDDLVEVTGLDDEYVEVTSDEFAVWLEYSLEDQTAVIRIEEITDDSWPDYPNPVGYDDAEDPERLQTSCRQLLAYFRPSESSGIGDLYALPGGTGVRLIQVVPGCDLLLCTTCFEFQGEEVKLIFPYFNAYVI